MRRSTVVSASDRGAVVHPTGKFYIVRHGESGWNQDGITQGQSIVAPGLTEAGRGHAMSVARELEASDASLVVSSDLRRARETAEPISAHLGLPTSIEPRLRERALGDAEGRHSDALVSSISGVTGDLVSDADASPDGGETLRELYDRIVGVLRQLAMVHSERRIIIVTHGGPVRVARALASGIAVEDMGWPPILNGSVFEVDFSLIAAQQVQQPAD